MTILDRLEKRTATLRNEYNDITVAVMKELAENLKPDDEMTFTDWRVQSEVRKYSTIHEITEQVEARMRDTRALLTREILEASNDVERDNARYFSKPDYELAHRTVESIRDEALKDFHEKIDKTLLDRNIASNSIRKAYDDILNRASRGVVTGNMTLENAIEKAVMEVFERGLPSEFWDKAGRNWSIERYAEAVTRTAMQNTYNEVRTARMEQEELYTVLVSSHPRSREACSYCQGKVIDIRPIGQADSGYPSAYEFGYGTAGGHRGINCRHQWFPFDPEINENNQPQYEPEEAQRNEAIAQYQNALARRIRKTKGKIEIAKSLESENVKRYEKLLKKQQKTMREFVDKHNLVRDYNKERLVPRP